MKRIKVNMEAFFGYGCGGGSYGTEAKIELNIEDAAAETLNALKASGKTLDQDVVKQAIADGHAELQAVYDEIAERFYNMDEEYWLFGEQNEFLDDSLMWMIKEDIDSKKYKPEVSFKTYVADNYDEKVTKSNREEMEEEYFEEYYEECREHYIEWLKKQDRASVAERMEVDLEACREEDEVGFVIEEME